MNEVQPKQRQTKQAFENKCHITQLRVPSDTKLQVHEVTYTSMESDIFFQRER